MDLYDSDGSLKGLVGKNILPESKSHSVAAAPQESRPLIDSTEAAYLALHIADWGQTRNIAKHPEKWNEVNKILGPHPSTKEVDRYFALTGLGHVALSKLLEDSPQLNDWFKAMTIGLEAGIVGRNKFKFGINSTF